MNIPDGKYAPWPRPHDMAGRQWPDRRITAPPVWASVDLRDGNQALVNPMGVEQKLAFFDLLVRVGFKEIEVGFPSASETEYTFIRRLIDEGRVPDDVSLQVLCQAREHLVKKTFASLQGAQNVIFHIYNSTSPAQRKYTFGNLSKEQIVQIALDGVKCVQDCLPSLSGNTKLRLEYSPESFSMTEIDFSVEICERVKAAWGTSAENKIILNLPTTVECTMPNVFADQVEYFCTHITERENVTVSIHNHNDRGTGVASCELGILAGADRVEGTLFGNGERTGNLDIVTVALNMVAEGVDPHLDFSHVSDVAAAYERLTGMHVGPRLPYAGELVFTAFSGSHQDAIRKGMTARAQMAQNARWDVPYLLIDPHDIGREYQGIIRINSQSGKGGAAYILEETHGIMLPKAMHEVFGAVVKAATDDAQRELTADEVYVLFAKTWLGKTAPLSVVDIGETHLEGSDTREQVLCRATVMWNGTQYAIGANGNGPLDAFVQALRATPVPQFDIVSFHEHSIGAGSNTSALAYVQIALADGTTRWGAGKSSSVGRAGIAAVVSAVNFDG
ncbi:MAG: 2-isopropylmalate synthase [Treponema sp.]|nr:2-isopropylmalate synthase [Treponema sp.]